MNDKNQDIWDAIGKLKLRDRLILLFVVIAMGVAISVGIFYLILRTSNFDFHIPESTLRDTPDAQAYRMSSYTDLPLIAQFPGTNYATMVGGTSYLYNDNVASFRYSDEQLIILGVFDETVSIQEFYTYALVSAIDSSIDQTSVTYTSMVHDDGYLNTLHFMYEGGSLNAGGTYYLVSYIHHIETGKNLLMMALTNTPKQSAVDTSKKLVDKMLYSMRKIGLEEAAEVTGDATGGSPASDSYGFSKSEDETMTDAEQLESIQQKVDETSYAIEYPDAEDLEYYVTVSKYMEHAVFYIDYVEVNSVPQVAYLVSPGGTRFVPDYLNTDKIGMVYWEIDVPEEGNWLIHLSKNARYGQFFAGVETDITFKTLYGENENPQPRDGQ